MYHQRLCSNEHNGDVNDEPLSKNQEISNKQQADADSYLGDFSGDKKRRAFFAVCLKIRIFYTKILNHDESTEIQYLTNKV
ncbi:hypothetical protein HZS_1203 [Henneguya salminicola]|nr:hypothetical protein HZS_1203 [Henneguya salminicola]